MKNIPLVLLGVFFTCGMVLALQAAGTGASPWILGFLGALTFGIDFLHASSKKTLSDILRLESIVGFELEGVAKKVDGWKRIFDNHLLLSIAIKAIIATCAACLAISHNSTALFSAYIVGSATLFGAGALMLQNYFFSKSIEKFHDRKTVEARQLAAGKKAAEELLDDSSKGKPAASSRRKAPYRKVSIKAA